ncbi:MAG: DUF1569 domain-containing protein [Chitinophagaceae bacterium]|nr:MAG: DUF1569 domain-containing protein [Chitinophagaceae bacterium]
MNLPDIFTAEVAETIISRIDKINPDTKPLWGKMNASQVLAHLNVAYDSTFTDIHPTPNFIQRLFIKAFAASMVVGNKPYPKNGPTAPWFKITGDRDFEAEKKKLLAYIRSTAAKGEAWFEGKKNKSFGVLTANQWNTMFYKHLEHHLTQFGV